MQRSLSDSDDESGSKVDVSENLGNESSSQMIISTPLVGSRIDGSLVDGSIASLMVGNFQRVCCAWYRRGYSITLSNQNKRSTINIPRNIGLIQNR